MNVFVVQPILERSERLMARPSQRDLPQNLGQFLGERVIAVFGHRGLQALLEPAAGFHRERDQVHGKRQPEANAREPLPGAIADRLGDMEPLELALVKPGNYAFGSPDENDARAS